MAEIFKFIYIMIIFITIFLVPSNYGSNIFINIYNFFYYFVHNIYQILSKFLILFFNIGGDTRCVRDTDCHLFGCYPPKIMKCDNRRCRCTSMFSSIDYVHI